MARRSLVVAVLVALFGSAFGLPAEAGDHKPPRTRLNVGARQQWGRLLSWCWDQGGGGHLCADSVLSFPTARAVAKDHRARITILKDERPKDLSLEAWKEVADDGRPVGNGKEVDFSLRKKQEDGKTVWRLIFRTPDRIGHWYLGLFAVWPSGDAFWSFHLKLS